MDDQRTDREGRVVRIGGPTPASFMCIQSRHTALVLLMPDSAHPSSKEIPLDIIPEDLRETNARFWITFARNEPVLIERQQNINPTR